MFGIVINFGLLYNSKYGGNKMKKVLLSLITVFALVIGMASVSAMTEAELKTKLTQAYTINGEKYWIGSDLKVLAERYLDQYEVSETDCDYISGKIDAAIQVLQNAKKADARELSNAEKEQLKALVSDVNANTSVKATVTRGSLVVFTPSGEVFAEVNHLVKQTDAGVSTITIVAGVAILITLAGAALVVRQVKHN